MERAFKKLLSISLVFTILSIMNNDRPSISLENGWHCISPNKESFSALFPDNQNYQELEFNPKNAANMIFKEHKSKDDHLSYSIMHTNLPLGWNMYGTNKVLNYSFEQYKNSKKSPVILQKNTPENGDHNVLEYKFADTDNVHTGKLIIHKDKIYKVETTYAKKDIKTQRKEILKKQNIFIKSFEIN